MQINKLNSTVLELEKQLVSYEDGVTQIAKKVGFDCEGFGKKNYH